MSRITHRLLVLFLSILLISPAAADPVDLSGMSFDDLVALRDQLNIAIWNSREWQEITVPAGIYQVGVDIPSDHWSSYVAKETNYIFITYFDPIDRAGLGPDYSGYVFQQQIASADLISYGVSCAAFVDIDLQQNWYLKLDGAAAFTPYAGKPDLGFN